MKVYIERDNWPPTVRALAERLERKYPLRVAMLRYADGATKTVDTPAGVPTPKYRQWGAREFADLRREGDLHLMYPEFSHIELKTAPPKGKTKPQGETITGRLDHP